METEWKESGRCRWAQCGVEMKKRQAATNKRKEVRKKRDQYEITKHDQPRERELTRFTVITQHMRPSLPRYLYRIYESVIQNSLYFLQSNSDPKVHSFHVDVSVEDK